MTKFETSLFVDTFATRKSQYCCIFFSLSENEVSARVVSGNQLTASSTRSVRSSSWPYRTTYYYPSYARLRYTGGTGGWIPATNNVESEYLEVSLCFITS